MIEKYRTINGEASSKLIEKKSIFISMIKKVESEYEAQCFIDEVRQKYYDARHHVYAYIIGANAEIQKYSDDGEPGGTAGLPVFDVLKGEDLKNVVIVVTRYFGGILLGKGGLVRAYGKSAKEAVLESEIEEKILCKQFFIQIEYTLLGKIQNTCINEGYILKNINYEENVTMEILAQNTNAEKFEKQMIEITNGNIKINQGELYYT